MFFQFIYYALLLPSFCLTATKFLHQSAYHFVLLFPTLWLRSSCGHSGHQICISFLDEYDFLCCAVHNCPVSQPLSLGFSTVKVDKTSTQALDALPLKLKVLSFQLQKLTKCPTLEDLAKQQKKIKIGGQAGTCEARDTSVSCKEDSKQQYKNPFVKGKGYGSGGSSSYGSSFSFPPPFFFFLLVIITKTEA